MVRCLKYLRSPMATIIINPSTGGGGDIVSTQITDSTANGRAILTAADYAAMRTLLSLVVGTNVQAQSARLSDIVNSFASASTSQGLRKNAAGTALEYADVPWNTVDKTTDESRTSTTTNTSDTELLFPVAVDSLYEFEMHLIVTGTATTGGLRMNLALPANAFANYNFRSSASTAIGNGVNTTVVSSVIAAAAMVATQVVFVFGQVYVGATSGDVVLQWSQNASSANPVTIKAGTPSSKLLWRKIA